jgi:hypothetical protein
LYFSEFIWGFKLFKHVIGLEKKKKKIRKLTLRLGLKPAHAVARGGEVAGRRRPSCGWLALLGLGLVLGSAQRPGGGRAVHGCTGAPRGLWSAGLGLRGPGPPPSLLLFGPQRTGCSQEALFPSSPLLFLCSTFFPGLAALRRCSGALSPCSSTLSRARCVRGCGEGARSGSGLTAGA